MKIKKEKLRLIPKKIDRAEVTNIEFNEDRVWLEGYTRYNHKRTLAVSYNITQAEEFIYQSLFYPYTKYLYIAVPILEGYYLVIIPALKDQSIKEAVQLFDNVFDNHEAASMYIKGNTRKENPYDDKTF